MKINAHKSLIREISPGKFIIGNNLFSPALEIDSASNSANIGGSGVLLDGSLTNITGVSLNYESAEFNTKPTVQGVPVLLSGEAGDSLSSSTLENLAKKWAIILG
ncbi:MAG: hypothetical protein CL885_02685 [Dehalococcoidia bacterium]|nr:hypothetical protein [Dehalococcoidia bacterium]